MHEINVLPIELSWLRMLYYKFYYKICLYKINFLYNNLNINNVQGGYPDSNRELTVPHTVVLPIELYPP